MDRPRQHSAAPERRAGSSVARPRSFSHIAVTKEFIAVNGTNGQHLLGVFSIHIFARAELIGDIARL